MHKTTLSIVLILAVTAFAHGQRKSELIAEIATLKSQLDSVNSEVLDARKNEKISLAEAESYKVQVTELQDANATLMKNLNSFAEVSNKNTDIVNSALATVQAKEAQLKSIQDALASHDSTAIVVLTNAKQTLGENAKIGVSDGAVIVSSNLESLFGNTTGTAVAEAAETWLGQIAAVLKANPETDVTISGLSMTGELDLAALQAAAVAGVLQKKFAIAPERILAKGMDGNFKEGVNFKIHPKYETFYLMVKEEMKK
ncbi:MAG: hypothetical protein ACR2MT_14445 [Aurantibacter sp.]